MIKRAISLVMILLVPTLLHASFQITTSLPEGFYGHVTLTSNGYLYKVGGIGDPDGILAANTVYYASINPAGTVNPWKPTTPLPTYLFFHSGVVVNGFIYVLGGDTYDFSNGFVTSNQVFYSKVQSDGTLGPWSTGPVLPQAVAFPSAASWNGAIYITGGLTTSIETNGVYFTSVNSDGSLNPWQATTPLPTGVYTHTTVQKGRLYVIGGATNNGAVIVNTVLSAPILPDKTVGPWISVTSLPTPLSLHSSQIWGNTIYVTGGFNGTSVLNTIYTNPIQSDGTLGPWMTDVPMPQTLEQHSATIANGYLYITGGQNGTATQSTVYYSALPSTIPVVVDVLPPRTSLNIGAPNYGSNPAFVTPNTQLSLSAVDDLTVVGDGLGVGVQTTQWAVDSGSFAAYAGNFTIGPDGLHWLRYYSVDKVGNTEAGHAVQLAVDGTTPISSVTIGSPQAALTSGNVIVGPQTQLSVSAYDPAVNGVASGVSRILAGIDGAPLTASNSAFQLPAVDGSHSILTQAIDHLQNVETPHPTIVFLDATPPITTVQATPPPFISAGGVPILGASSLILFTANDPVVNGTASGINHTEYSVDGGRISTVGGPVSLNEGIHFISYRSIDNVGNAELTHSTTYWVDTTAPMSTLQVGSPSAQTFNVDLITADTLLTITATDPVSNGVASGISRILFNIDGGANQVYSGSLHLAAGTHTFSYGATDNAGNLENMHSVSFYVSPFLTDTFEGINSINLSGLASVSGTLRSNGAFTASQGSSVNGNVTALTVALSGSSTVSGTITQGSATLPPSLDLTSAQSWSSSNNNNAAIPPSFLVSGALVLGPHQQITLAAGTYFLSGLTIPDGATLSIAGKTSIFLTGPIQLSGTGNLNDSGNAENLWIFSNGSNVTLSGNAHAALNLYAPSALVTLTGNGDFTGRILGQNISMIGVQDVLPPRTTLTMGAPTYGSNPAFIAPSTLLSLSAVDDALIIGDGKGVGVQMTQWAMDSGAFATYQGAFTIGPDGLHWVRFLSTDKLGNSEAGQAVQLAVDGTAPISTVTIGSPQAVFASNDIVVSPQTGLHVSAVDPVVNGAASGVGQLLFGVDNAPLAPANGIFQLPAADGAHTIRTQAIDNVQNTEAAHQITIFVDQTPPVTSIQVTPFPYMTNGTTILSASSLVSFAAADPVVNAVAAGVNHTEYSLDGGNTATVSGAIGLAEGVHLIKYRSFDNVGNAEQLRSANYSVDTTPPQSTLAMGTGITLFGVDMLTTDTPITITAQDPVSNGVTSGVSKILYSIDGGADQIYSAAFHLPLGAHTISYGAIDNAGNAETRRSLSVSVGTFLTDAIAAMDSVTLSGNAKVTGTVRTNASFNASGNAAVNGDVFAMTATLTGNSTISGAIHQGQATLPPAAFDLNSARAWVQANNNDASIPSEFIDDGALKLNGNHQLTLTAGNYYFTGLSVTGNASLFVSGQANVFLHGPLTLSGNGTLNSSGDAVNLWIFSDTGNFAFSGNARTACNIYAPLSSISISGNGAFAGRILGLSASLSGNALEPSSSVLPPPQHNPGAPEHRHQHEDGEGHGTSTAGRCHDKDDSIVSAYLAALPPDTTDGKHGVVVPPVPPTPELPPSHTVSGQGSSQWQVHVSNANSNSLTHSPGDPHHLPPPPPQPGSKPDNHSVTGGQSVSVTSSRIEKESPTPSIGVESHVPQPPPAPPVPPAHSIADPVAPLQAHSSHKLEIHFSSVASMGHIPPSDGGHVEVSGHASVDIPGGAAGQGLNVTVSRKAPSDPDEATRQENRIANNLISASAGTQFGPEGTKFNKPVTITLAYDRSLLPPGASEDNLAVHYWNPVSREFEALASVIDKVHQTVSAQVSHFSFYQVLAGKAAPSASNSAVFALGQAYAFPNPATHGAGPTLHIEAGSADSLDIRIFDLSGALVNSVSLSGPAPMIDDGSGRGPLPSFEYKWNVNGVGSGVYIFTATANKSGAAGLTTKGKVVVIK